MKYSPGFQKIARYAVIGYYRTLYRVKIYGRENIPSGGCLVCGNHPSIHDPMFALVALSSKYEVSSMGKKELFENKFLNMLLTALGGFPVDRGKTDIKAIKMCLEDIKNGKKFILFPEGTRTEKSGKKAKAGIGLLAMKAQCPILPIYIDRAPKLFGKINLVIGEPVMPPAREEKVPIDEFAQNLLDHIFKIGDDFNESRSGK